MSIEDRLRTALHDEADGTHVDPASFDRIERRTAVARRRRRAMGGGLALVAVVAAAVGGGLALQDDGEPVRVGPASDSRETTTTTSTTTRQGSTTYTLVNSGFVWPGPGDDRRFATSADAARAFGIAYLGMADPVVEVSRDRFGHLGESRAEAELRPRGTTTASGGGPRTLVELARTEAGIDPMWRVVSAASPDLEVDVPAPGAVVSSPLRVSGRGGYLYEANVIIEVRAEGVAEPLVVTNTTAAGSGTAELAPFSADVTFEGPTSGRGAIVLKADSGIEGTPHATVVPVTFGSPSAAGSTQVTVFLQDQQGDFVPVTREVPRTTGVLRASLEQQLLGAYPGEQARGLTSPFSEDGDLLRGVTISGDGTAVVDFEPGIVDALSGADGAAVLASLDRTAFQFSTVTWVRYSVGGQCTDFAGIGTDLLCERRSRDEY